MRDLFNPLAMLWSITLAAIVWLAVTVTHATARVDELREIPSRVTAIETQLPTLIAIQMATLNSLRRANGLPPVTPAEVLAGDDAATREDDRP